MRVTSYFRLSVSLLIALCALGAALVALGGPPVLAQPLAPSTIFTYPGSAPCNTTLQACISAANHDGDVVFVIQSTYITNELIITHGIELVGAGPNLTKLQALGAERVISVGANIAAGVTISNLRVFSGSLTSGGGLGAGIFSGAGTPLTLVNVDVLSNTNSTNSGGGIFAGGVLTMTNVNVMGNSDAGGAGGGLRAGSSANIVNSRFERNAAGNAGGGLRVTGPLTLTNVTVISNSTQNVAVGDNGGGISALGGLFMAGGLVQNNVSNRDGGGISANAATITAANIISNAADNGGGIFVTGGLAVTNTTFDKNTARAGHGGSIYASGNVTITLEGTDSISKTSISNSTAVTNGGGIFAAGNVLLVGAVSFNADKALNGEGGAIYTNDLIDSSGTSVLLVVNFTNNHAQGRGGAVRALGQVRLLNSPAFQNNQAGGGTTADGGGIYADGSVFLSRGTSANNSARNGGAIYAAGDITFNVHNTVNNTATVSGGCGFSESRVLYNSAHATGCVAAQFGGAAYAPLTVTLQGNGVGFFNQNRAGNSGGVAFANVVQVFAAQVVSNSAPIGGAIVATKTLDVADSTLSSNTAATMGGAAVTINGTGSISNSIFTTNRVTGTSGIGGAVWVTGTLNITNSTFVTNTVALGPGSQGGAIAAKGRVSLLGDTFQGNQASTGGAVLGLADVFATNTTLAGNGGINNRSGGGMAAITTTLTSVTFTQNSVCCTNASGGALSATLAFINNSAFIQNSAFISGGAVLAKQVFITGSLFLSNTQASEGGGVWTQGGAISNTQFTANSTGCCSQHAGGALYSRGQIFVHGSQFIRNESDHGGAIFMQGSQSEIHDSTFTDNFVSCCDGAGAIDAVGFFPAIYNSTFTGNHVDCCDGGGAIRATDLLYVEASTFSNNSANSGDGGAIKRLVGSNNTTFITASTFISNFSGTGGGAVFGNQADIENSTFISNHVASFASGGAVAAFGGSFIAGSSFTDNRVDAPVGACSSGAGGAVFQDTGGSITVQSSSYTHNSGPRGGALFAGSATIEASTFSDNSALCLDSVTLSNIGSGGAVDVRGFLSVKRSSFVHNSAGSLGGGAIAFLPFTASPLHIENSLFARNVATNTVFGAHGAAIVISQAVTSGQLFFNTFADQPRNPVSAIAVYSGTVSAVDNIISGHATGIERIGGTAFEDFNLYFDNGTNLSGGVSSGGSSLTGSNPLFVSPPADNYHLRFGSPAIDRGHDIGITNDFDGDTRPIGAGFDIGFDERSAATNSVYLPLIVR